MFHIVCVHTNPEFPPLALGLVVSYAKEQLDKTNFEFHPVLVHTAEELAAVGGGEKNIFLFSNYIWNAEKNMDLSRKAKSLFPNAITIHGGPNIPIYEQPCREFLTENPHIDFAVRGAGEDVLVDLLRLLLEGCSAAGMTVGGVSALIAGEFIHNDEYGGIKDLDKLPSPYLTDYFAGESVSKWEAATIETNRGCPYNCVYCGWGLMNKVNFFSLERIFAEIDWIVSQQVATLWIADANFGISKRDFNIAKYICDAKERTGYPKRVVVNFSKNTHNNLVDIVKLFAVTKLTSTGVISLQTRDEKTLAIAGRKNIKTSEYDRMQEAFAKDDLPLSTQLMMGLPGSTRAAFEDDLRYYFNRKIEVQIFRTIMLCNTAMAAPDFQEEHGIVVRKDGLVLATNTIPEAQLEKMTQLARVFQATNTYGILFYIVIWLQFEHGLDPINILSDFVDDMHLSGKCGDAKYLFDLLEIEATPTDLLATHIKLREEYRLGKKEWHHLANEFCEWVLKKYGVDHGTDTEVVLTVQTALMPRHGRTFPEILNLDHDITQWYADHRNGSGKPLVSYGPGKLTIEDPLDISGQVLMRNMPGRPRTTWRLHSELMQIL